MLVSTLQRCALFAGLPRLDLERIAEFTVFKWVPKDDYLFYEGTPVHGFFIVRRGAIKLFRVNLQGREQVIHIFRLHESFAEETVVSDLGFAANARATEDSQVLMVQKHEFLALLKRRPELSLYLLRSLNRHVRILIGLLADLTLKDVKTRLAHWLLEQCPDPESAQPFRIELGMTKNLLAAELGTASETLSRTLGKLRARKLIVTQGKNITLPSPRRLTEFLKNSVPCEATTALWTGSAWTRVRATHAAQAGNH